MGWTGIEIRLQLLLDTHTFIWLAVNPTRLSARAATLIQDPRNMLYLSLSSIWEMQLKLQTGKLHFNLPLPQLVADHQQTNGIRLLPLAPTHIYALDQLPFHHKDPFDRLLIAQALIEQLPLLSADTIFTAYPIQLLW